MKMLKKLALVSAVSMISAGAFAMEAMDDESMSAATGQDGITIKIIPGEFTNTAAINAATTAGYKPGEAVKALGVASGYKGLTIGEVRIHDDDGLGGFVASGNGTGNSGAIVIGGGTSADITLAAGGDATAAARNAADSTYLFTNQASAITVLIDSVGDFDGQTSVAVGAMLNINIATPTLRIQTGAIYVANSNAGDKTHDADGVLRTTALTDDVDGAAVSAKIKILDGMGLTMGASATNIQLGTEAQGAMIVMNTTMTGGLTIDNLSLNDAGQAVALTQLGDAVTSGGSLFVGQLKVTGNNSADLALNVNVDVGSRSTMTFPAAVAGVGAGQQAVFKNQAAVNNGYASYAAAPAPVQSAIDTAYSTQFIPAQSQIQDGYNGLVVSLVSVGGVNGMDIALNDLRLGDTNAQTLGDIQIVGLNVNGTKMVIMGH